jgi:hypothetical protein
LTDRPVMCLPTSITEVLDALLLVVGGSVGLSP